MDTTIATEELTDEARALATEITARIDRHRTAALAKGNEMLAKKWQDELTHLAQPSVLGALAEVKFNPEALEGLAIYAAQKLRRLALAYLGTGRVDPYTETVLKNAQALRDESGRIANRLVMASLTTKAKVVETLPTRRAAAIETAATQASSTRKALVALGAGRVEGKGKAASLVVDFHHPFVARVVGVT